MGFNFFNLKAATDRMRTRRQQCLSEPGSTASMASLSTPCHMAVNSYTAHLQGPTLPTLMSSAVMLAGCLTAGAAGAFSFFGFFSFLPPPGMPLGSVAAAAAAAAAVGAEASDEGGAATPSLPGAEAGAGAALPSALPLPFSATFSCTSMQNMCIF